VPVLLRWLRGGPVEPAAGARNVPLNAPLFRYASLRSAERNSARAEAWWPVEAWDVVHRCGHSLSMRRHDPPAPPRVVMPASLELRAHLGKLAGAFAMEAVLVHQVAPRELLPSARELALHGAPYAPGRVLRSRELANHFLQCVRSGSPGSLPFSRPDPRRGGRVVAPHREAVHATPHARAGFHWLPSFSTRGIPFC